MNFGKNGIITSSDYCEIPNIYKRVEYIQSVGATQYIDTLYPYCSTNNTYEIECDFNIASPYNSTYEAPYGAYKSESHNAFRIIRYNSDTRFEAYSNTKAQGGNTGIDVSSIFNRFYVIHNYDTISLNGTSYTIKHTTVGTDVSGDTTFFLFRQSSDTGTELNSKIYYFSLKDSGQYVRRLFPVIRLSDSKPGMYDVSSGTFFVNSGTGEFTAGPDLGNNVGIYSDKIVSNNFIEI